MESFISLVKELRLFIALIATVGGVSAFNVSAMVEYVHLYNVHLVVLTLSGIYVNHFLSNKRHIQAEARLNSYQSELNKIILENSVGQLKAEVRQAYKDYSEIEAIDFPTTVKYLQGLDKRRIALKVNSYTEAYMKNLLNKVKYS